MMENDDLMVLENIDEYVNDENKVVSYKWLSLSLQLNVNRSKRLLETFVEQSSDDSLEVIYFIGGWQKIQNSKQLAYMLVKKPKLEDAKEKFNAITCCHIYSIQKCSVKHASLLYAADLDIVKESLKQSNPNQLSSIRFQYENKNRGLIREVKAKEDLLPEKPVESLVTKNSNVSSGKKEKTKATPPLTFFGKKPTSSKKHSDKTENQAKPLKKQEVMKTTDVPKDVVEEVKSKPEVKKNEKTKMNRPEKILQSVEPIVTIKSKKRKLVTDDSESDDDFESFLANSKTKKKGDRVEQNQEDANEEVDVIAPTPESKPKTKRRRKSPDKHHKQKAKTDSRPSRNNQDCGVKLRGRRKVLRSKQFEDEQGFMVTQKVYESESFSEDEVEVNTRQNEARSTLQKSSEKPKHQSSLMSFFGKK